MTVHSVKREEDAGALSKAVAWKIHPAIGFARVGNSPSGFFFGPEAFAPESAAEKFRDEGDTQAMRLPGVKRQAALFRIYAYDAKGHCLGELTAQSGAIAWRVALANRKASGARAAGRGKPNGHAQHLRNQQIPAQERWRLDIAPQPRHVSGTRQRAVFDDGRFMDMPVSLGEIRTDAEGRLIVLGGSGKAHTYDAARRIVSAHDNDYWYDDVSDGPVTATVTLADGRTVEAAPAWVVVTPPDYAPGVSSIATQFDVLADHAVREGQIAKSAKPSFRGDILPILERIAARQWIDRQALVAFGHEGALDLEAMMSALAINDSTSKFAREAVFQAIARQCERPLAERWLRLTPTQLEMLQLWAEGVFESDWPAANGVAHAPSPETLDRAALEASAGGTLFPSSDEIGDIFLPGEFRFDHAKLSAGAITQAMPCPWQAGIFDGASSWQPVNPPRDILPAAVAEQLRELDEAIAGLPRDGEDDDELNALKERRQRLWMSREAWARGLAERFPASAESLVKEWQHLGFVAAVPGSEPELFAERERSPYLGSFAEYFHRLVNFEENLDFAPKALEMAYQMLADAKFGAEDNYAPFRYTPAGFDERLDKIYADRVRRDMHGPIPWESGELSWNAIADYDGDGEPVWKSRRFHVGAFSDKALRERFKQYAPENLTDGAWLQNVVSAAPMDAVQSRLASIWLDEAGGGHMELNHANVYVGLLRSLGVYMPPVNSREFIEQDFVPSAFQNPVFQFCVGRFPKRFLPEILGMTLFMEWEATPISTGIANMMAERRIDPQYYRMHAGIDNINAGHGALAKEAVKLYLNAKQQEGGDDIVQEHWQRIWRGYVAWATLANGHDEIVERMMVVDKKQIHLDSSLLSADDILPAFAAAVHASDDPVSRHLRGRLEPATRSMLSAWNVAEPLPAILAEALRHDANKCICEGLYDHARFAGVQLSQHTSALLEHQPQHRADFIELGRCLLEDAYPGGIARRTGFPDIKRHYADKMAGL
ncbi:MAG TPA: LodA/GoxA family CTQ-dependent oxidase, partial [Rhizomicrobium sp.]|nr:LodA/GoxA family CTQ-dependent oxidase [Rhizomicrobium sp.]